MVVIKIIFRVLENEYKVNIYVKIAQLYLEDDEAVQAEVYLNRAAVLIHECKDPLLHMRYKVTHLLALLMDRCVLLGGAGEKLLTLILIYLLGCAGLLCSHSGLQAQVHRGLDAVL